jgi:anti-anti-sigma factor
LGKPYVLRIGGDLDITRYGETLSALASVPEDARQIVVDLSEVRLIDSMALGALILTKFRWDQEGKTAVTVVADARVRRVMNIGNVIERLNVVETLDEALRLLDQTCSK